MQAARTKLDEMGVAAIGISPDSPILQKKFAIAQALDFPLLSDSDYVVALAYGAWGEKSLYGKKYAGIIRSAFLIDEGGLILGAWYKISPEDTVPRVLECLPG